MNDQDATHEVDEEAAFQKTLEEMEQRAYTGVDATQKYLNELGAYSVLTAEEEIQAGTSCQSRG